MNPSLVISVVSAVISVAAVVISVVALWKTHLAKFKLISVVGDLRLRIYPIRSAEERWFIPSVVVPGSLTNGGARLGRILCLRLTVSFPSLPIPGNREYFYPQWELDYGKFEQMSRQRFQWIEEATVGGWMPFAILPQKTVTKYLVFESRWNEPVIQDQVTFVLEVYTDSTRLWKSIGKWDLQIGSDVWSELASVGSSIGTCEASSVGLMKERLHPPDLHKYTGSKEPIPEDGFQAGPSFLDYREDLKNPHINSSSH